MKSFFGGKIREICMDLGHTIKVDLEFNYKKRT